MNRPGILLLVVVLLCNEGRADHSRKTSGWPDSAPLTKRNFILALQRDAFVRVDVLGERLFRIRHSKTGEWTESGLNRYGIFSTTFPEVATEKTEADGAYVLRTKQGDSLLVSAFSKEVRLPEGVWIDFWSGKRTAGPATLPVEVTPTQGGALWVKSGAIIPTWPLKNHVEKGWSPEIGLLVYPAERSSFTLYEDDGASLGYRKGQFARTLLSCETSGKTVKLSIGGREGSYAGMPETRDFTATIQMPARPGRVSLDGTAVTDYEWNDATSTATVRFPACGKTPKVLILN